MGEMKLSSPDYDKLLSEFVELRKEAGLSQKGLAQQLGVAQSIVGRVENKTTVPAIDKFMAFLEPFGKTLAIVDLDTNK